VKKNEQIDIYREIFSRNRKEVFLIDVGSGKEFTYGEVEESSLRAASFLRCLGVQKGDRVAFVLPNSIEYSILYFACMQIGAAIVPINQRLQPGEIATLLSESEPHILITTPVLHTYDAWRGGLQIVTIRPRYTADSKALHDEGVPSHDFWEEIKKERPIAKRSFEGIVDSDILAVIYTSGTTSRPKGVPIQFGRIARNGRMFARIQGIPPGVRFLGTFSQGYLGGLYNTLLFQFFAEGSVVLDAGFDASVAFRFWETVQKFKVTALWPVPSMLSIILSLDRGKVGETYARKHVKYVLTGTSPLTPTLRSAFENRYGVKLYENFALSETFFISSITPYLQDSTGVGKIVPGCAVWILDEEGKECPIGVPGEIVVKSDYMADGYFKNPEETAARFRGGKFYTGDVGYIDSEGCLFITDRKKDIIIRGGINISPREIEDVISAVKGVREVAVVGIPHAVSGEEVVAAVVAHHDVTEAVIKAACSGTLAPFKVPSKVIFYKELPKSPTGKVQKHIIKDRIQNNVKK